MSGLPAESGPPTSTLMGGQDDLGPESLSSGVIWECRATLGAGGRFGGRVSSRCWAGSSDLARMTQPTQQLQNRLRY